MDPLTLHYAKIGVNVVLFVLDVMGIKVSLSNFVRSRIIDKTFNFLWTNPVAKDAIKTFVLAFKTAWGNNDTWKMAKDIFDLLKSLQIEGLLWIIIESVVSEMSKWDWFMTGVQISLNITATIATEGLALIAKISSAILSANHLLNLIAELPTIS